MTIGRGSGTTGTSIETALAQAAAVALAVEVRAVRPLSGGDINLAFALELADGRSVFAKTNPRAPAGMFVSEARGLGWLAASGTIRVPRVLAANDAAADTPAFLALELIETARPRRDFSELLGQQLAALHQAGAPAFGLDHDNFIGSLPQSNRPVPPPETSWADFYRIRRLQPLLTRAAGRGLLPLPLRQKFDRLFAQLEDLVGPPEPPARLHGDLWGGNLLVDADGGPCLIDPAVYGGHREIDLAMMRLFGGFDERVFAAYDEAHPLAPGAEDRVPLYQLYPLLVHVCLFGGSYVAQVESALRRLV
jgi:fructosamine-3-kinase